MSTPRKYYKILQNKGLLWEAKKGSLWTCHLQLTFSFVEIVVRSLKVQENFSGVTDSVVSKARQSPPVLSLRGLKPYLSLVTTESPWYSVHWNTMPHVVTEWREGGWVNSVFSYKFKKCRLEGSSRMDDSQLNEQLHQKVLISGLILTWKTYLRAPGWSFPP